MRGSRFFLPGALRVGAQGHFRPEKDGPRDGHPPRSAPRTRATPMRRIRDMAFNPPPDDDLVLYHLDTPIVGAPHRWTSGACHHGRHDECHVTCRFCGARCECPHHGSTYSGWDGPTPS